MQVLDEKGRSNSGVERDCGKSRHMQEGRSCADGDCEGELGSASITGFRNNRLLVSSGLGVQTSGATTLNKHPHVRASPTT